MKSLLISEKDRHIYQTKARLPSDQWKPADNDSIYWVHYHELDDPTEDQLLYLCHRHSPRWYGFLLQRFPTEQNFNRMENHHCKTRPGRTMISVMLSNMLRFDGENISVECLELIMRRIRSKKVRRRARKLVQTRQETLASQSVFI